MPKTAVIETARGTIRCTLFEKEAPKTVANFVDLAKKGYYDGTTFHRVIKDFMIQGGDPLSKTLAPGSPRLGTGGPGYTIPDELVGNPHKHSTGALSMAKTAAPNSGGSQFFITHRATPHLDGVHTVFGHVVGPDDQKVVNAIQGNDKVVKVTIEETA